MFQLTVIVWLFVLVCSYTEAARILAVFPTPSISHQVPFRPLTQELARLGHEIVVITPDPAFPKGHTPANMTEIDVHDISYELWRKMLSSNENGDQNNIASQVEMFNRICLEIFEKQTQIEAVREIIEHKNNTFDLLMVEAWMRYPLGFSYIIKAPVVAISSFGAIFDNYHVMGAPIHHLLYPQAVATRLYNLTFLEKIHQFCNIFRVLYDFKEAEARENAVIRRIFGENTPALSELQNNIDLLFVNMHPIWEGNRPVPPSVIHLGGMPQKPKKQLPQELQQYLESSAHGVIYLSFGTNVDTSTLPKEKIQTIINVFSRLPYDVLWKWNEDELPGRTKNIQISKWLPQSDLLRHSNVKLFIMQGGLQSTDETITAGVPVVCIPMLGDQWYNAEKYEYHRIGKKILLQDLDEKTLEDAIKTVIEDKSYRENVVRLRTLMNDQPMTSLERAVWWTEHVLRHGGRHLRSPAANMAWAEYYELDLVLVLLCLALTVTLLISFVFYKLLNFMKSSARTSNKVKLS